MINELMHEPLNLVVLLIAVLIAIPLFSWLLTLVQATFRAVFSIAAIGIIAALILIVLFGVSPDQIIQQVNRVPQRVEQIFTDGTPWKNFSQAYGKW